MASVLSKGRLIIDNQLQMRDATAGMTVAYRGNGFAFTSIGEIYVEDLGSAAVPSGASRGSGMAFASDGRLYVTTDAPTSASSKGQGIVTRPDGALHVTSELIASGDPVGDGIAKSPNGALRVAINSYPLDNLTGATAGYSVSRKLRFGYTGPLFKLRRASDNEEQDFYAESTGRLNVSAVASFISGTSGYLTTLYDQQNAFNATASTTIAQPLYVANAVNGRSIARFDGTDDMLASASGAVLRNVAGGTIFAVARLTENGATDTKPIVQIDTNTTQVTRLGIFADVGNPATFEGRLRRLDADTVARVTGNNSDTNWHVHCVVADYSGAKSYIYDDAVLVATLDPSLTAGSTSNTDSASIRLGANGFGYSPVDIAEALIYPSAVSASLITL